MTALLSTKNFRKSLSAGISSIGWFYIFDLPYRYTRLPTRNRAFKILRANSSCNLKHSFSVSLSKRENCVEVTLICGTSKLNLLNIFDIRQSNSDVLLLSKRPIRPIAIQGGLRILTHYGNFKLHLGQITSRSVSKINVVR